MRTKTLLVVVIIAVAAALIVVAQYTATVPAGFWWNWWAQTAAAVFTAAAAFVALFGERLKSKWFLPALRLDLSKRCGVLTKVRLDAPDGSHRFEDARYWFQTVSNAETWPVATGVRVCLMKIEERDASGDWRTTWSAELPVLWDIQEAHPSNAISVPMRQRELRQRVQDLLDGLGLSPDVSDVDPEFRTAHLDLSLRFLVASGVLNRYLLLDEMPNDVICSESFPPLSAPTRSSGGRRSSKPSTTSYSNESISCRRPISLVLKFDCHKACTKTFLR